MPKEINNIDREFMVFGLRRTGNHAIINWILPQIQGDFLYYNDVWPNDPYKGNPKQFRGDGSSAKVSLISFEDYNLRIFKRIIKGRKHPIVKKRVPILILRDPFNWYASRLKSNMSNPAHYLGLNLRQLYLQYLREYQGDTNLLGDGLVTISFNRWKSDLAYRQVISERLGLEFTDDGLNKVTGEGGGSSFDGMKIKGQELNTETRYRHYLKNAKFLALFSNLEIINFSKREFFVPSELQNELSRNSKLSIKFLDNIVVRFVPRITTFLRSLYLKLR